MPQTAFAGDIAYDWELWIGRTVAETTTWTQIFGFETLPLPEQVPEDQDVTHMQSPGRTKEEIPGILPVVSWAQEKQLWPESPGDLLLEELSGLTASGTREEVLIEFNPNFGGVFRRTYRGYVNSFTPTGSVGTKAMANTAFKIMNRQPTNPRTIPED